jgi:peptidoglycan/LPS O-acetylase OafA/YrhL
MPELDSIRGIAVLFVVFYHGMAPPLHVALPPFGQWLLDLCQYGWIGVNIFFVLSGFLITGILLDSKLRLDYFRRFYFRRVLRILPALYVVLLALLIGHWITTRFAAISVFFLANFSGVLGIGLGYGVLWSLAVEEHFYMFWPALVRLSSSRTLIALLAVIFFGSPFLRVLTLDRFSDPQHLPELYTWFNLDGLALGSLLAIWLRSLTFQRNHLIRAALPAMMLGGVVFVYLTGRPWAYATVVKSACNLFSAGLLSVMLLIGTSQWRFLVNWSVLRFFGFISYGLYLVHILAFHLVDILCSHKLALVIADGRPMTAMLVRFTGGFVLATALAYLSRKSLEQAFLRIGHSSKRVPASSASIQVS